MSAPAARTVSGASPFTVACVPTGMKAGVATAPCSVTISPQRAAPSVAISRKENAVIECSVMPPWAIELSYTAVGPESHLERIATLSVRGPRDAKEEDHAFALHRRPAT